MATLLLQVAGAAVGSAIAGPVGAMAGRALGALAGAAIDTSLLDGLGSGSRATQAPRLSDIDGLTSTEGAGIPRVYGRARIGGQLIWATRPEAVATKASSGSGSSGGKSVSSSSSNSGTGTSYSYFANLAIGLCEGRMSFVRRVWADGQELDQATLGMRVYYGGEGQLPDPLIVAKEGLENAPAYRGLAYVVFERLPLADYGNRIPQFAFEVVRAIDGLGSMIRAVDLIPGASEFGYDPTWMFQALAPGVSAPENRHQLWRGTDVAASIDALQALCPNVTSVAFVVSWFGDDLRAQACTIAPRVESYTKVTSAEPWSVGGLPRVAARLVSQVDGRPAYGGTPSDLSVIRLIAHLKARGLKVVLYPFVMMDVPAGNLLPDPHTGAASQPPYPWRGRITCDPAPGRPGSPDGTAIATLQVNQLFGTVAASQFAPVAGQGVLYLGPNEWSLRRLVLHYAHLAQAAGGVDGFVIGSELVGLTRVRGAAGYPAVDHLTLLAADVRAVVGAATKVLYAADWTEYGAHARNGGADISFPLDPLFASPAIDAVGIDFYAPISDWRDGTSHLDAAEARSIYDPAYLARSVGEGPDFDWYYASDADRAAQVRSPITDGSYGKPWVFRTKDLIGWWSNPHVERTDGVETAATAWVPASKPIWLTEIGVPAVDKGTNGPNVFPDPKSSENAVPPFSRGSRDDLMQLRGLEAILTRFDPARPGHQEAWNPVSPVYGGPMVDPSRIFVWAWDARPFPTFPALGDVWADGANWEAGHWITGRVEGVELDRLVRAILADLGMPAPSEVPLDGFLDGYVLDRPLSARGALEPLGALFGFDAVANAGSLRFVDRRASTVASFGPDNCVPDRDEATIAFRRGQDSELPCEVRVGFTDSDGEYRRAAAASRRLATSSRREAGSDFAVVTRRAEAQRLSDIWLQDLWIARETAEFSLSPREIALEAGDMVRLAAGTSERSYRITRIADGAERKIEARAIEPSIYDAPVPNIPRPHVEAPRLPGQPYALVLDLPLALADPPPLQYLAVFADPWPGRTAIWRSADGESFALFATIDTPAVVGETTSVLGPGPLWRFDWANTFTATLRGGALSSVDDLSMLSGRNTFAVRGPDGAWEILAAATIELIGDDLYRLSRLVRGLGGSEGEAGRVLPAGAPIVLLDETLVALSSRLDDLGRPYRYRIGPAGRDYADPTYIEIAAAPGPLALKPYAPVHVRARRTVDGVVISWVRRTRLGGDAWDAAEVPLSEESERYEIDVLTGSTVLRTLAAAAPSVLYVASDETSDFGTPQTTLTLAISQLSATVGRGFSASATVSVE